jgi:hypothetical protein
MPACAWPGIVQRQKKLPAPSLTVSVVVLPGATFADVLPLIEKLCAIVPLFESVKTTLPGGTLCSRA